MTRFASIVLGRGALAVHVPVFLLLLLITAAFVAPSSPMRPEAYGMATFLLMAADLLVCTVLHTVRRAVAFWNGVRR